MVGARRALQLSSLYSWYYMRRLLGFPDWPSMEVARGSSVLGHVVTLASNGDLLHASNHNFAIYYSVSTILET